MEHETMNDEPSPVYFELGNVATGTIEAHQDQIERLEELTERAANGEFHIALHEQSLAKCIDGRRDQHAPIEAANSAGGSYSHVVAHALMHDASAPFAQLETQVFNDLSSKHVFLGVHSDTHANDEKSGCGANDRLRDVFTKLVDQQEAIRQTAEVILGQYIEDDMHDSLISNAKKRDDFGSGVENFQVAKQAGATTETLEGDHKEVLSVINLRGGTTLDRETLATEFSDHQIFNIDAWAFMRAAEQTEESDLAVYKKIVALTYFNLATAMVLAGPSMRVAILKDELM